MDAPPPSNDDPTMMLLLQPLKLLPSMPPLHHLLIHTLLHNCMTYGGPLYGSYGAPPQFPSAFGASPSYDVHSHFVLRHA